MSCSRLLAIAAVCGIANWATAQIIYTEDFDDGAGATRWSAPVVGLEEPAIGSDGDVDYAFDYSAISNPFDGGNPIPSAPNSTGGSTTGVYITSNNTDNCPADANCTDSDEGDSIGIVSAFDLPADNFILTADLFLFWNGGGGSTEYTTIGVFHDGSDNAPLRFGLNDGSGVAFQFDTDGDTGTDIIGFDSAAGQTGFGAWQDIPDGTIPGVPTGPDAGPRGPFSQWVEVELSVFGGNAVLSLNGVEIANLDGVDTPGSGILLGHSDAFNSVNNAIGGFTSGSIWDNVVVELPEPSTAFLLAFGAFGVFARRR